MKAKEFQGFVNEFLVITISIQYFEILRSKKEMQLRMATGRVRGGFDQYQTRPASKILRPEPDAELEKQALASDSTRKMTYLGSNGTKKSYLTSKRSKIQENEQWPTKTDKLGSGADQFYDAPIGLHL
ncbi:hypothetical protein LguiB_016722 [Lonicera macranthoides]